MSTSCEAYVGYTVTLKENLTSDDFEFFWEFIDKHGKYNLRDCENSVSLVTDGMCGEFARLIYVDHFISECWVEGKSYYKLRCSEIPDDIYQKLNTAYNELYGKELDKSNIEYALWYLFC